MARIADSITNIRNLLQSEDLSITLTALRQMGMEAVREEATSRSRAATRAGPSIFTKGPSLGPLSCPQRAR